jgi:organic radical activating enzyme
MQEYIDKYKIKNIFLERYFLQNVKTKFVVKYKEFMFWKRGEFLNSNDKKKFYNRFLLEELINFYDKKEINIPQIEFDITSRCTLRCKNCFNLMPYFKQKDHIDDKFDEFKIELDNLLSGVNSITKLNFLGGEPLINKNLAKMIEYSAQKTNIGIIEIITNGTLIPNQELINVLKRHNTKVYFYISNYSNNAELKSILKHDKIIETLKLNNIKYQLPTSMPWFEEIPLERKKRTLKQTKEMFRSCYKNPCVCIFNGKIHVCARSSSGYELGMVEIGNSDFIDLRTVKEKDLSKKLIAFYSKDCFDICKYCLRTNKQVLPAEQLK